ncbi:MAG: LacI family transcriptional regulator [Treponema sp.]|nr:LacI family transcriptional regulator [Treponema sp.]
MVTIYDIAKATGVSAPTVSKALNGIGTMTEATRNKILETAKQLGYEPNMSARTLTTKKSHLIGVVYDDTGMSRGFGHPLFSVLLNRFREQIEQAGYDIIFLSRHFGMSYFAHSKFRSIDGLIIITPDNDCPYEEFLPFVDHKVPCVSTNTIIKGICTVITENESGGYKAAEYFIKKGHTKIAFLSGPRNNISFAAEERLKGFKKAFSDYGLSFDENLFEECDFWHVNAGYEAFKRLYSRTKDFTAIFACSDLMAYGVMQFAEENGISLPDDLSIIGFDDDSISEFSKPHLTTFRHDAVKIADMAAEMLFQQLTDIPVPEIIRFPAEFIERDSVKLIK